MKFSNLQTLSYNPRNGRAVRYGVLHTTQGTDSRSTLVNAVSVHYLIRNEGGEAVIYNIVNEAYAAWHCGIVVGTPNSPLVAGSRQADGTWSPNPNLDSIGIEMEGFAAGPVDPVIVEACIWLVQDIRTRYPDLPFINHSDISDDRSDPGVWRAEIDKGIEMPTQDQFDTMFLASYAKYGVAALFDTLKGNIAAQNSRIGTLEARTDVATLSATLADIKNRLTTLESHPNVLADLSTVKGELVNLKGEVTAVEISVAKTKAALTAAGQP